MKEINGTKYIVAIDSAYFLPDGAYFNAYMAVDFPGADKKIAFAAKDIRFNPKGVMGGEQASLQLASEHFLNIGPNIKLHLPSDGSNFVKWGCNGFESVNLHGAFIFSKGILEPTEGSGDTAVTAEFEVNVQDIHNMLAMVDFSEFQIRGMDNYDFEISAAVVDMSDIVNPPGVVLPPSTVATFGSEISLWRGFHLKTFTVGLPDELSKNSGETTIYAQNLFIDNSGVTGQFGATDLFSTSEGSMEGKWGFSVSKIEVGVTSNKLTAGLLEGQIGIPALDNNTMNYSALVQQDSRTEKLNYLFAIRPDKAMSMSAFNSTLTLSPASTLSIERSNGKFKPKAILHGDITVNNENLRLNQLKFESFTLVSQKPFVTDGLFSLVSSGAQPEPNTAGKFPVQLSEVMFGIVDLYPVFGCRLALNFCDTSSKNGFSGETAVRVFAKIEQDSQEKYQWSFERLKFNDILLGVHTNAFNFDGQVSFRENDPVYGTGFYGRLLLQIKSCMDSPLDMQCAFGKKPQYRYWMIDATVPVKINVANYAEITSFSGGLAYHMINTRTNEDIITTAANHENRGGELSPHYLPDAHASVYLKSGIGFKYAADEKVLNADHIFSIGFNEHGGFDFIQFDGMSYSLCKRSERATAKNYITSRTIINYDHGKKILNCQMVSKASFANAIEGSTWSQLYISPNHWHFYAGSPSNPGIVTFYNFASASTYLMLGMDLPPMAPPPPQVASVMPQYTAQRDIQATSVGKGVATGAALEFAFEKKVDFKSFEIYSSGYAGAGFDMTMYQYADGTHCKEGAASFGMNNWYLNGQLYAFVTMDVGLAGELAGKNIDVSLISANSAMLLAGKLPNPSYISGNIHLDAKVLNVIDVKLDLKFDKGTECEIISG